MLVRDGARETPSGPRRALLAVLLLVTASTPACSDVPSLTYLDSRVDPGYMYVYAYSEDPQRFTPIADAAIYLYTESRTEFEIIHRSVRGPGLSSRKVTMDWEHMMYESLRSITYFPTSFAFSPKATYVTDFVETRSFAQGWVEGTGKRIENGDRDRPVPFNYRFALDRVPRYQLGLFPEDLVLALRHLPEEGLRKVGASRSGYEFDLDIRPSGPERVEFRGNAYNCRRYVLSASGLIGTLFGKKGLAWLEADSGLNFLVKYRDENLPFYEILLVDRRRADPSEWEALKDGLLRDLGRRPE